MDAVVATVGKPREETETSFPPLAGELARDPLLFPLPLYMVSESGRAGGSRQWEAAARLKAS